MSDKIIVGTDGSDTATQAVNEAVRLAKALGAELHVVTGSKALRDARVVGAAPGAKQVYGSMHEAVPQATVDDAAAIARLAGVEAKKHVVDRDGAEALLTVAEEVGASMIVVGNKGMSGGRRVLGSVPNTISHRAPCSVLIVSTG